MAVNCSTGRGYWVPYQIDLLHHHHLHQAVQPGHLHMLWSVNLVVKHNCLIQPPQRLNIFACISDIEVQTELSSTQYII